MNSLYRNCSTLLLNVVAQLGRTFHFTLQSFINLFSVVFHFREFLLQFYQVFVGAIPLAIVAGLSLGAVVWMHLYHALSRSGTTDALPTFLSAAVFLELAPIGAGLIVAGRTGAGFAAEIGAMKQSEQLDALELIGKSPIRELIVPRIVACIFALPLITILIASIAILSGYISGAILAHTTWLHYQSSCLKELYLSDIIPALLKTPIFGWLIATVSCYKGLQCEGGTIGIGKAATQGIVYSTFLVLIADVYLVALIRLFLTTNH